MDVLEAFARSVVSLDACFSSAYRCDWPGGDLAHNSDVCRFSDLLQGYRIDNATVLPSKYGSEFAQARTLAPVKTTSCQKL